MGDQDELTVLAERHQVGFPMARCGAGVDGGGALVDGDIIDKAVHCRPSAFAALSAFCSGLGQELLPIWERALMVAMRHLVCMAGVD